MKKELLNSHLTAFQWPFSIVIPSSIWLFGPNRHFAWSPVRSINTLVTIVLSHLKLFPPFRSFGSEYVATTVTPCVCANGGWARSKIATKGPLNSRK